MEIALLMTGEELMAGDIVDSNAAEIAHAVMPLGVTVGKKITVGDRRDLLVAAIEQLRHDYPVLIINGGLGPTVDDLTAEVLAEVAGVSIEEHPQAMAHLSALCQQYGLELNAANRKQAMLPAGCDIIPNPAGTAVGIDMQLGDCRIWATPGVPHELRKMLRNTLVPTLGELSPDEAPRVDKFKCFGLGESRLQQMLHDQFPDWPETIEVGFRAGFPVMELKLISRGSQHSELHDQWNARVEEAIADYLMPEQIRSLQEVVIRELIARGKTVSTAESCTGGMIASQLTEVPGSSQAFVGACISYSNAMKTELLGVDANSIETHGAVSETVVREMVSGALSRTGSDYAVAVSGIAGPDGGTEEKPVGTVFVGWGDAGGVDVVRFHFKGDRKMVRMRTAAVALDLLRRRLCGITNPPAYLPRDNQEG